MTILKDFVSLLYPEVCLNCNDTLISSEKFICTSCKADLPETMDHLNHENLLFQKLAFLKSLTFASSYLYFSQGGIAQKILHQLKYAGQKDLGIMIGEWYGKSLKEVIQPDMIVPVPLHRSKIRNRGYNQSTQLAYGLSKSMNEAPVIENLVYRKQKTMSQTKKSKTERWLNMANVYSESREDLSGCSVLIIDDVITTGATVGMLCERLEQANVGSLHVVSIARK